MSAHLEVDDPIHCQDLLKAPEKQELCHGTTLSEIDNPCRVDWQGCVAVVARELDQGGIDMVVVVAAAIARGSGS